MSRVLIADDDRNIAALIADNLQDDGIETTMVYDGEGVIREIGSRKQYDLILLDIMMPKLDGIGVVKQIRDKVSCPILFVTAKARTLDTLLGLEMGADDYITKPFVVEELVGKVKAHIRRDARNRKNSMSKTEELGQFMINKDNYEVYKDHILMNLTTREFQLFYYLYENRGKVLTREQIFDAVWGADYSDIGSVNVTIKSLRDKLDQENKYIKTVWGVGYKLVKGEAYESEN